VLVTHGAEGLLGRRVHALRPWLHLYGHTHFGYGVRTSSSRTIFVNASSCDELYCAVHPPVVVDLAWNPSDPDFQEGVKEEGTKKAGASEVGTKKDIRGISDIQAPNLEPKHWTCDKCGKIVRSPQLVGPHQKRCGLA